MDRSSDFRRIVLVSALLSGLVLAVFWPVAHFEFQSYDDQKYVTSNRVILGGLTWQGIAWAFETFHSSNWHPLTWISHMLDVQCFGLNPGAHHLGNLFLHLANTLLLLLVLNRMTGALWRSALVAALFALHPTHVESVAWVAERKDVLSTFFFMLTLWAYTGYAEAKSPSLKSSSPTRIPRSRIYYSLSLLCFALGLLSKPMLVTLPFVLLLLDFWPLGRFAINGPKTSSKTLLPLLVEKLPYFALVLASSVVTFLAQQRGGSVASLELFSFGTRLENALAAYAGYLQKLIWPTNLAVLYLPPLQWSGSYLVITALVLIGISVLFVRQIRPRPYLLMGWLWFLGTLVPVIGLVQVGSQYMADRYCYVPFIGCFIGLVWGSWDLVRLAANRSQESPNPRGARRAPLAGAAGSGRCAPPFVRRAFWTGSLLLIAAAAFATRHQLEYWRTPESLFRHCVAVTTNNYVAYNNLGAILVNQGRYAEAKPLYAEALRINPYFADAVLNMGTLLAIQGDTSNAVQYLQQVVRLDPQSAEGYGKLAMALSDQGQIQEAIAGYTESLRLNPDQVTACNNLAWILATHPDARIRNGREAVRWAERACELTHYQQPMLAGTLAAAYAEGGRFADAIRLTNKAIDLATANGQKDLVKKNRELLALYQTGTPYHEPVR